MADASNKQALDTRMGTDPIPALIARMSIPSMFSMLIQALYNIVDSMFVARINETALSAVSLVFPLQMLNSAVAVGTAIGLASLISRRLGAGLKREAQNAANNGIFLAACSWLVFLVIGTALIRPFANAFSENPLLIEPSVTYGRIVMSMSLFIMVAVSGERIMQACGNVKAPMLCSLAGCIANIILDPIMIFGYFGLPAMGVAGAAYATVIGQFVSMAAVLICINVEHLPVKVSFKGFKPDPASIKGIYGVGLPAMVMQAITSLTTLIMNAILIVFSETGVAVLGVYFKLQSFVFMPVFGLNQGTMPIMGYNYGARKRDRLLQAFKLAMFAAMTIMLIGTLVFQLIPDTLMGLFNAEGDMITMGRAALRYISLCFPFAAFGIICGSLFQATGHGMYSLIISVMRQLVLIVPLAFIFSRIWGVDGVWMAYPAAEGAACLLSFLMLRRLHRTDLSKL